MITLTEAETCFDTHVECVRRLSGARHLAACSQTASAVGERVDTSESGRTGYLVEYDDTEQLLGAPREEETKHYIAGDFG